MIDSTEITPWDGLAGQIVNQYFPPPGWEYADLMQEARIGVYRGLVDYRPDTGASLRTFIALCVRRQVITALKTATRGKHTPLNDARTFIRNGDGDEVLLVDLLPVDGDEDYVGMIRAIFTACEGLSPLERRVFELLVAGHSYGEAGVELRVTYKTIDNAWQRAVHKLRDALQRDGWEVAA